MLRTISSISRKGSHRANDRHSSSSSDFLKGLHLVNLFIVFLSLPTLVSLNLATRTVGFAGRQELFAASSMRLLEVYAPSARASSQILQKDTRSLFASPYSAQQQRACCTAIPNISSPRISTAPARLVRLCPIPRWKACSAGRFRMGVQSAGETNRRPC
jgi:hypothetical protein